MVDQQIQVYGATTCPDTIRARRFFAQHGVTYEWYDIDQDERAHAYVVEVNGRRVTPTIKFPDGSILVEPSTEELAKKLGINL